MDRCGTCGGSVTTGGCINTACMAGPGGYYRNGVKVAPANGPVPKWVTINGHDESNDEADAELARVVAWLRMPDATYEALMPEATKILNLVADALERHAHRKLRP